MSFTFTNAAAIPPVKSGLGDLIGNILSGYTGVTQAKYLKPTLEQDLQKAKLFNQWYGPNMQSEIGLRGAQAGHLGSLTRGQDITNRFAPQKLQTEQQEREFKLKNPFFGETGTSGDIGRMLYLRELIKNNPELMGNITRSQNSSAQNGLPLQEGQSYMPSIGSIDNQQQQNHMPPHAEDNGNNFDFGRMIEDAFSKISQGKTQQFAPSPIRKLQQELKEIESGYYPGTNRTEKIDNEQTKEELAAPYREKLGGLKGNEHYIYDPETHEKIGTVRPYTPREREVEKGRNFFNEVFPAINEGFKNFIGKDSVKNFVNYANDYGKNEVATRNIDNLLLAQKLATAGVVNEASTLGAGKTNMTYKNLMNSFPKSDIPNLIERYGKELKLPGEAYLKANIRFNNMLNQATQKAESNVPAMKKLYFQPEKHLKYEENTQSTSSSNKIDHYSDEDIKATAHKYHITEAEVKKRLKEHKRK